MKIVAVGEVSYFRFSSSTLIKKAHSHFVPDGNGMQYLRRTRWQGCDEMDCVVPLQCGVSFYWVKFNVGSVVPR